MRIPFQVIEDKPDGKLLILEGQKQIPFDIKRIYFISNMGRDSERGKHAHKEIIQAIFCLKGSFELITDDGFNSKTIYLIEGFDGVLLPPLLWHEMNKFSENCLILVVSSDVYKEEDYIRNYQEFKHLVTNTSL